MKETDNTSVTLLDFGCGTIHLYEYLPRGTYPQVKYSGLDISPNYVKMTQTTYPHITYHYLDILDNVQAMPKIDYVVMNAVVYGKT